MDGLSQIRKLRRQLGITQEALARAANVSQSLIAKIESGRTEPSFSKASQILSVLEEMRSGQEPLAKGLMVTKVLTCRPGDSVRDVIGKMKRYEISQLPVMHEKTVVGLVSESSLMEHVLDKNIDELKVSDVMLDAPPTVSEDTPESAILPLLKYFPLVVVVGRGELKGVITKADIIRKAYS